ncbi:MAG TPA: hypothetical protein VFV58_21015 [Blastocatellia bacterium]|jgi:hypothetical protein|nr:hypothetical protein [Blastocatellia bacterium]
MFCPSCGFEYTQKTNYCKRCGESLSLTGVVGSAKMERPKLAAMFCAVAAFGVVGMITVFSMYNILSERGLRGDELMLPFMMGMMFTGAIAGLLIWQLARMITAYQKGGRNVIVEKHYIRESPPTQLGAPTDQIQQAVEPPSVVEHTTRQMAGKHK